MRIERTGEAGDKGGDDEALALEECHANAAGARGIGVLTDGVDRTPEARTLDAREGEIDDRRHADVEVVAPHRVAQRVAEQFRARDADKAVGAAGQPLFVLNEQKNDDGEAERSHGEVSPRQPRYRHHQQAGDSGSDTRADEGERKRHSQPGGQQGGSIGADAVERRLADGKLSGIAEQHLQSHRRDRGDRNQAQNVQRELVRFDPRQRDQRGHHQQRDGVYRCAPPRAWVERGAHLRFCHSPTRPEGKTRRMAISRIMPMPSL